jgi:hypothetical protein
VGLPGAPRLRGHVPGDLRRIDARGEAPRGGVAVDLHARQPALRSLPLRAHGRRDDTDPSPRTMPARSTP